jgi:hypothetical protein
MMAIPHAAVQFTLAGRWSDIMRGMRFRFATSTLLLIVAAVAISCGGMIGWGKIEGQIAFGRILLFTLLVSPLWLPFAFFAFAVGRRVLTARMVLVFAIAEGAAVGISYWIENYF